MSSAFVSLEHSQPLCHRQSLLETIVGSLLITRLTLGILVCFVCCFDDSSTTMDTAHRLSSDISLTVPDLTLSTSPASVLGFLVMIPNVSQRSSSHGKIKCKEKDEESNFPLPKHIRDTGVIFTYILLAWTSWHDYTSLADRRIMWSSSLLTIKVSATMMKVRTNIGKSLAGSVANNNPKPYFLLGRKAALYY